MPYSDLQALLRRSSSSRAFFLSLSPEDQLALHTQGSAIHSAQDLRQRASSLGRWRQQLQLGRFPEE